MTPKGTAETLGHTSGRRKKERDVWRRYGWVHRYVRDENQEAAQERRTESVNSHVKNVSYSFRGKFM